MLGRPSNTPENTSKPSKTPTLIPTLTPEFVRATYCEGALGSNLEIGDRAIVNVFQLSARSKPSFNSRREHVLARDRIVEIVDGPACVDEAWWWKIYFSGTVSTGKYQEYYAWMVEADYDTYYLLPAP